MARLRFRGFPAAPNDGDLWCAACAVLAKGKVVTPLQEQLEAALADKARDEVVIDNSSKGALAAFMNVAVTWGPCVPLGGAVVPLCWDHIPAVDGDAPPPAPPGAQAPGLFRGRGGLN